MFLVAILLVLEAMPCDNFRVKKKVGVSRSPETALSPPEFGFEYETRWLTCKSIPDKAIAPKDVCTYPKGETHGLLGDANGVMLTSDTHYFGMKRNTEMSEMELVGAAIPTVGGGEKFCGQLQSMSQLDKVLSTFLLSGERKGEASSWVVSHNVSITPFVYVSLHEQMSKFVERSEPDERSKPDADTQLVAFAHWQKKASTSAFSFFDDEDEEEGKWILPSALAGAAQVTFTVDFEKLTDFINDFHAFESQSSRSVKQRLGARGAGNWQGIVVEIDAGLSKVVSLGKQLNALGKEPSTFFDVNILSIETKQQALTGFLSIIVYYILMLDTKQLDRAPQYPKSSLSWLIRTNFANLAGYVVLRDYFNSLQSFELFVFNVVKKLKDGALYDRDVTDAMQSWLAEEILDPRTREQHYKWCMADPGCADREADARQIDVTIHDYLVGLWGKDGEKITYVDILSNRGLKKSSRIQTSIFESMGAFEDFSSVKQTDTDGTLARGVTFELRAIGRSQMSKAETSRPGEANFITIPELQQLLHDYYAFLSKFNHGVLESLSDFACD